MKKTSPNRISTELTSEKIKIMNDIDLNALFNLNYNFDLLKGIIEQLLKNQNSLQNQIDDLYGGHIDKDKKIEQLEKEVKYLKETYVNKESIRAILQDLKEIKEHLKKHDNQIEDIYSKLKDLEKLKDLIDRLNALENKIKDLDQNKDLKDLIDQLRKELEDLKKKLEDLTAAHSNTVIKVNNNKEQIEILFARLKDLIQGYKDGDENLQKQIDALKAYIDKKLSELKAEIDLLLQAGGKSTDNKQPDLSGLANLMRKVAELESEFREFVTKVNIDEIYRQLKFLTDTKADKKDLEGLNKKISSLTEKYERHDIEIESIKKRLDGLLSQLLNRKDDDGQPPVINVDFSQYVTKIDFEKHKKENDEEHRKIWEELKKIKDLQALIDEIMEQLKKKANKSDLDDLKALLLGKIDELAIACNKKFADKNETTNNFKYLEEQIKKILDMLSSRSENDADNWLLAKKPINGYSCASCESYIGDLRDDTHKFIPWNKMPLRDPGDKLYRMGNGFSKMLQMLNFDNNGNVCLNPNIVNEATLNSNDSGSRVVSAFPGQGGIQPNKQQQSFKKRIQSANPSKMKNEMKINKFQYQQGNKDTSNNELGGGLPKIKNDGIPDIYEKPGGQNEDGPKITKVYRKTNPKTGGNKDNGAIG